jgi:hypothetical protein
MLRGTGRKPSGGVNHCIQMGKGQTQVRECWLAAGEPKLLAASCFHSP